MLKLRSHKIIAACLLSLAFFLTGMAMGHRLSGQSMASGQVYRSPSGGTEIKMLLQTDEVEVAEITFPGGTNSGDHEHGATEIFYVLSGELTHAVNGKEHVLGPGMLGYVEPPDKVNHVVSGSEPTKALVIWAPGGEGRRIVSRWEAVE